MNGWEDGGREAYLDTRLNCCMVSALAASHYIGCCRRRTHTDECDSASPPHKWKNTHSTLTTPHLKLSLPRKTGWEDRGEKEEEKERERAITNYHAGCSLHGKKKEGLI